MTDASNQTSTRQALTWAVYLAVSWTWCVGMFLPILLLQDYGMTGFVLFAITNVVGAAAMGWMLRTRSVSAALCSQHAGAIALFSIATIAFHLFFVWYLSQSGWVSGGWWPWITIGVFSVAAFSGLHSRNPAEMLSPLILSNVVIAFSFYAGIEVKIEPVDPRPFFGIPAIWWLAPVLAFGFFFCPYLDATFHRARQNVDGAGAKIAFGVGFGVFFFAMILFTLCYSGVLMGIASAAPYVLTAIVLHMIVQSGYTVGLHVRETVAVQMGPRKAETGGGVVALLLIGLLGAAVFLIKLNVTSNISPVFEAGYRMFMSAYGLFFPAYVWVVMIPMRREQRDPTAKHLAVWLVACAIAAPAYWMGFLEKQEVWLGPGLLVVLAARLLIPRGGGAALPPQGSRVPASPRDPAPVLSAAAEAPHDEDRGIRS